jgi:DNA-directed RNA polymerase subunit K/omega
MPKKQKSESDAEEYNEEEKEDDNDKEDDKDITYQDDEETIGDEDNAEGFESENNDEEDDEHITDTIDFGEVKNIQLIEEVLAKDKRITRNKLTKYEMVRILGERTKQLIMGAKPLVKNIDGLSYDIIAEEELKLNMIPFKVKRPLPNGKVEIWELDELDKSHLLSYL